MGGYMSLGGCMAAITTRRAVRSAAISIGRHHAVMRRGASIKRCTVEPDVGSRLVVEVFRTGKSVGSFSRMVGRCCSLGDICKRLGWRGWYLVLAQREQAFKAEHTRTRTHNHIQQTRHVSRPSPSMHEVTSTHSRESWVRMIDATFDQAPSRLARACDSRADSEGSTACLRAPSVDWLDVPFAPAVEPVAWFPPPESCCAPVPLPPPLPPLPLVPPPPPPPEPFLSSGSPPSRL